MRSAPRQRWAESVFALAANLVLAGCGNATNPAAPVGPTLITVDPAAFGGQAPCLDGTFQRYVATLVDISAPVGVVMSDAGASQKTTPFVLPSSAPIACTQTVSFAYVFPNDEYVARIDAYARTDIAPVGGPGSGSAVMVDPAGNVVSPVLSTSCGPVPGALGPSARTDLDAALAGSPQPTRAVEGQNVLMHDCTALVAQGTIDGGSDGGQGASTEGGPGADASDAGPSADASDGSDASEGAPAPADAGPGAMVIDIASVLALAGHVCSVGDVQTYRATVAQQNEAGATGTPVVIPPIACTSDVLLQDLAPGFYTVDLKGIGAEEGGTAPLFQASCTAAVEPGRTSEPVCTIP